MDLTYNKTVYFEGELDNPVDMARNTFLPNGFEIIESNKSYLEVTRSVID